MPRIKSFSEFVADQDRESLVSLLTDELRKDSEDGPQHQPLIFEEEMPQTKTLHVLVFWDKWAVIPKEQRASIILDAYDRADPNAAAKILIAIGLTITEGIELNFLPYQVVPSAKETDQVDPDAIKRAMIEEGAVQTYRGLQLAFPNSKMANAAWERLTRKIPGPFFQIAQTMARAEN